MEITQSATIYSFFTDVPDNLCSDGVENCMVFITAEINVDNLPNVNYLIGGLGH